MSHHGPVQAVLRHDAPATPRLARLSLLGSPVLEPDLNTTVSLFLAEKSQGHSIEGGCRVFPVQTLNEAPFRELVIYNYKVIYREKKVNE